MAIIGISGNRMQSGKDTVGSYLQYLLSEDSKRMSYSSWQLQIDRWYNYNDWQIKKFAGKLKDIVCILIGCTREDLEDNDFKNKELGEEWNISLTLDKGHGVGLRRTRENEEVTVYKTITPRLLLQLLGTEAGRNIIHPNIWCNALMKDYRDKVDFDKSLPPNKNWLITDVRFPNEAKAIKDKGGITIRVNRFKEKDKVYWTDPDTTEFAEGASSGVYSIIKLYDEFCLLSNDVGSETEVPYDEIKLYIEGQHESETALDDYKFHFTILNNGTLQDLYKSVDSIIHLIKKRL